MEALNQICPILLFRNQNLAAKQSGVGSCILSKPAGARNALNTHTDTRNYKNVYLLKRISGTKAAETKRGYPAKQRC